MTSGGEFQYRLLRVTGGQRPGSHAASSLGAGHRSAGHARLFDLPDPRRLDLRASLRDVRREWLVRTQLQRAAIPLYAVVDVSASMRFGAPATKLERASRLVESMGNSAFRSGDPAGLIVFAAAESAAIAVPARHSRGIGTLLGSRLRGDGPPRTERASPAAAPRAPRGAGLQSAIEPLAGRDMLVFLVSDFHWPLEFLGPALAALHRATVIPVVVWDRAEIEPPAASGLLTLIDAETWKLRTLWVGGRLRERWLRGVARRRQALEAIFSAHDLRPFHLWAEFDPVALSRYFLEGGR
jgi:uncharacterized protein (DUF58 family)